MAESGKVKLVLLGDPEVGKTSLLLQYTKGEFRADKEVTIESSFESKEVEIDGKTVEVQVWDTAGEERFRNLTSSTYRGAQGILLVYDVCNKETFDNLNNWVGDIKLQRGDVGSDVPTVVVGNKIDEETPRVIPTQDGKAFASNLQLPFYETSAKTNDNVDTAFAELVRLIITPAPVVAIVEEPVAPLSKLPPGRKPPPSSKGDKEGGCCTIY